MRDKSHTAEKQNDELLRLIAANRARLAKLQQTIAELRSRAGDAGEEAHPWAKPPNDPAPPHRSADSLSASPQLPQIP